MKQGDLFVIEYEKKFTELARYAMMLVASKMERCKRFEHGLRPQIRTPITTIVVQCDYAELVGAAL